MNRRTLEPGHTEATFRARHMMVTWVRGLFKDIHGKLNFDPDDPLSISFEGWIDARKLWTGEPTTAAARSAAAAPRCRVRCSLWRSD